MTFAKRLRKLRKEREMTQEELSRRTGIKRTTIASYEVGNIQPSFENVKILAECLGTTIDYLGCQIELAKKFDEIYDCKKIKEDLKYYQFYKGLQVEIESWLNEMNELDENNELRTIRKSLETTLELTKFVQGV